MRIFWATKKFKFYGSELICNIHYFSVKLIQKTISTSKLLSIDMPIKLVILLRN